MTRPRELMNERQMRDAILRLAHEIEAQVESSERVALVGIRTRGVPIAQRIHKILALEREWDLPLGILDITLYRDDLTTLGSQPMVRESEMPFSVDGMLVFLIDDVIFTGRTARSAIDAIVDFGRPRAIRLVTLIDRGWREYPIQPDICAAQVQTAFAEVVQVRLKEIDGSEETLIVEREAEPGGEL